MFGAQGHFLGDFFHVSEYLAAAAPVWRPTQQARLKRGAAPRVIAALAEHLEAETTPEEAAPVRQGHRHLSNRLDSLDYPGALALGLPIGPGMIESGHRHVRQARLKKAGTAWLPEHADPLAHLRVLRANHQWASLCNSASPAFNRTPCCVTFLIRLARLSDTTELPSGLRSAWDTVERLLRDCPDIAAQLRSWYRQP